MDKLTMAHEMAVAMQSQEPITDMKLLAALVYRYADAMEAEANKRASQKRAELRELLNHPNTFIEKEGMHFDDVEFEVDWDLAPENAVAWEMRESGCFKWFCNVDGGLDFEDAPSFGYTGDWRNSLRKRPEMEAERHALRGECE